jgi:hypothetical protein
VSSSPSCRSSPTKCPHWFLIASPCMCSSRTRSPTFFTVVPSSTPSATAEPGSTLVRTPLPLSPSRLQVAACSLVLVGVFVIDLVIDGAQSSRQASCVVMVTVCRARTSHALVCPSAVGCPPPFELGRLSKPSGTVPFFNFY